MTTKFTPVTEVTPVWEALDKCKADLLEIGDVYNISNELLFSIIRDWSQRNLLNEIKS
jgi:hypothetical protein